MDAAARRRGRRNARTRFAFIVLAALGGCLAGSPAAFAQAAPAQGEAQRREFTLFFGFASAELDPLSTRIVQSAAEAAKRRQTEGSFSHVKVIGYADTAGSAGASQRVSEARAAAVRDELVRLGLSGDAVHVEGRGKKELAVPTADRVREPRNRRARIVIYGPGE